MRARTNKQSTRCVYVAAVQLRIRSTVTSSNCVECWYKHICKTWKTPHKMFTTKTIGPNAFHRYRIKHYAAKNANQYHRTIQSAKPIACYSRKMKRYVWLLVCLFVRCFVFNSNSISDSTVDFTITEKQNSLQPNRERKMQRKYINRIELISFTDSTNAR